MIKGNIPGAWKGASLVPYNPTKILNLYQPTTTPFATLTDQFGHKVDISVDQDTGDQINAIMEKLLQVCDTPLKQGVLFIKTTCLTALTSCSTLQVLNQQLVDKASQGRKKAMKKHHRQACILTVTEIEQEKEEREEQEQVAQQAKDRRAALWGKVGFAKLVWKEMPVNYSYFD